MEAIDPTHHEWSHIVAQVAVFGNVPLAEAEQFCRMTAALNTATREYAFASAAAKRPWWKRL